MIPESSDVWRKCIPHPAEDIIGPRYPRPDELEIQEGLGIWSRQSSFVYGRITYL